MVLLSNRIVQVSLIGLLLLVVFIPPLNRGVFESVPFQKADAVGQAYVDEAFERALIAFALARAINAVISVIQDSEVDIAPAGVGVTIAAGEVLDPINDMIERFSLVMLVSLVSLGVQKFLIAVVPWLSLNFVLAPALVLFACGLWKGKCWSHVANSLARRLLLLALLLRFSVPAVALLNDQVYRLFLDQQYAQAIEGLEQGKQTLADFTPLVELNQAETGFMASLKETARQVQAATDLRRQIDRLGEKLTLMIKDLLTMIVVFLLNTVLLPLFFLWGGYKLSGRMTSGLGWPLTPAGVPPTIIADGGHDLNSSSDDTSNPVV